MRPAFVAAMVAAAAAGMPGAAALAAPPAPYHLLFSADRDGDLDVYAASVDGRGAVAVTHNSVKDTEPLLAPDGRSVAVRRGPDVLVLSHGQARVVAQGEPGAWSPDGRRLAVGSLAPGGRGFGPAAGGRGGSLPRASTITDIPHAVSVPSGRGPASHVACIAVAQTSRADRTGGLVR